MKNDLRGRAIAAVFVATLLSSAVAFGQEIGQWSWTAGAFAEERRDETVQQGANSTLGRRDFRLNLGMDGFFFDPGLGSFSLRLDEAFEKYRESGRGLTSLGGSASVFLLPRGVLPTRLFFAQTRFDQTGSGEASPIERRGIVSDVTSFGFATSYTAPRLGVFRAWWDRTVAAPEDRSISKEMHDSQKFIWESSPLALKSVLSLSRKLDDYPWRGYSTEELDFREQLRGTIPGGELDAELFSLRRDYDLEAGASLSHRSLGAAISVANLNPPGFAPASVRVRGNRVETGANSVDSYSVDGRWSFHVADRFRVGMSLLGDAQQADRDRGRSFGATLDGNWNHPGTWNLQVFGQIGGRRSTATIEDSDRTSTDLVAALSAVVSSRNSSLSSSKAGLSWTLNESRLAGGDSNLPDLGQSISGIGTQNRLSADCEHARQSFDFRFSARLRADWVDAGGETATNPVRTASSLAEVGIGYGALTLRTNYRVAEARRPSYPTERQTSVGGGLDWSPNRSVHLRVNYDGSESRGEAGPSFRLRRGWAEAEFLFRLAEVRGQYFSERVEQPGSPSREYKGFSISIGKQFSGWLPIVTAVRRQGVVE